jgi:hypothetical protein
MVALLNQAAFEGHVGSACAAELLGRSRDKWSGFVVPVNGHHVIVINPTHALTRQNATLTEELFHIRLGHKPSKIFLCPVAYAPGASRRAATPRSIKRVTSLRSSIRFSVSRPSRRDLAGRSFSLRDKMLNATGIITPRNKLRVQSGASMQRQTGTKPQPSRRRRYFKIH